MRAMVSGMFILLALLGGGAPQVHAQERPKDFFSLLFGGLSQPRPRYDDPFRRQQITITPQSDGGSGASRRSRGADDGRGSAARGGQGWGAPIAYCVRSCDGRYFPLHGQMSGASDPNAVAQCAAFCPATRTEVFYTPSGDKGIDGAVNKIGRPYSSSPNAFAYRERLVAGCSCTASGDTAGIRQLDILEDPTLKRGDIVMTGSGARVFTGSRRRPPYRDEDFVVPSRFPDLSRDMRQRLNELTVASR